LTYGAAKDPEAIFYTIGVDRGTAPGTATMEVLYNHGPDLNFISERCSTPLNFAIRRNLPRKLKFLLDHGADPNLRPTKWDQTAFEYAKERGPVDLYKMLEDSCGRETA
jgi:ankyrin repeat protein